MTLMNYIKSYNGETINGYTIDSDHFAFTYCNSVVCSAADRGGKRFLLKVLSGPNMGKPWHREFIECQEELSRRINQVPFLRKCCHVMVDSFEFKSKYWQVFDWIDFECNLEDILRRPSTRNLTPQCLYVYDDEPSYNRIFSWRAVVAWHLMTSLKALHEEDIVLEAGPENIGIVADESDLGGVRPVILGLNGAILGGQKAPWYEDRNGCYFGSHGYWSPEHLKNTTPTKASNIFSYSLMLLQLFGQGPVYDYNDFDGDFESFYKEFNSVHKPNLRKVFRKNPTATTVADCLQRGLRSCPYGRPAAGELLDAINGKAINKSMVLDFDI